MAVQDERKQQAFYLSEQTREALKTYVDKNGGTLSDAAEKALQQFLAGAAAEQVAETASPAIEDAVGRRVAEELRTALLPVMAELKVVHLEAAMGRLETYAHIANDYGQAEADKAETMAQRHAETSLARGELRHMQVRVS